jgi:hypothetical protein
VDNAHVVQIAIVRLGPTEEYDVELLAVDLAEQGQEVPRDPREPVIQIDNPDPSPGPRRVRSTHPARAAQFDIGIDHR